MAAEHNRNRDPLLPLREGDFQRIPGIGPGIAQRLNAAGIQTFRQLAAMTSDDIYASLNGLVGMTAERITHQDWPGQAGRLAQEIAAVDPPTGPEEPGKRQHYASFILELLQDETDVVRRTRISYIQKETKESWAGWDMNRLEDWIMSQVSIAEPHDASDSTAAKDTGCAPAVSFTLKTGESETFSSGNKARARFLIAGQPFEIHLPLKIKTESLALGQMRYRAIVQARSVASRQIRMTEVNGQLDSSNELMLNIPVDGLEEGAYRLETSLLVYLEDAAQPEKEGSLAFSESGLVYVYSRETETVA